jgi:Domain of unknown function (DUF222)
MTSWPGSSPRPGGWPPEPRWPRWPSSPLSAQEQIDYSAAVATRLPKTFAALAAGRIHPVHVRIIEDETRCLSDADAATAGAVLNAALPRPVCDSHTLKADRS